MTRTVTQRPALLHCFPRQRVEFPGALRDLHRVRRTSANQFWFSSAECADHLLPPLSRSGRGQPILLLGDECEPLDYAGSYPGQRSGAAKIVQRYYPDHPVSVLCTQRECREVASDQHVHGSLATFAAQFRHAAALCVVMRPAQFEPSALVSALHMVLAEHGIARLVFPKAYRMEGYPYFSEVDMLRQQAGNVVWNPRVDWQFVSPDEANGMRPLAHALQRVGCDVEDVSAGLLLNPSATLPMILTRLELSILSVRQAVQHEGKPVERLVVRCGHTAHAGE